MPRRKAETATPVEKPKRARKEPSATETVAGRIDHCCSLSGGAGGKMPLCMVIKTQAELDEALAILKKRKITHITARLETEDDRKPPWEQGWAKAIIAASSAKIGSTGKC